MVIIVLSFAFAVYCLVSFYQVLLTNFQQRAVLPESRTFKHQKIGRAAAFPVPSYISVTP